MYPILYFFTTIAGQFETAGSADGTNGGALFGEPTNLAVDTNGNVYVSDRSNNTLRKLTPMGTNWVTSTIAGLAGQSGSANGSNSVARFNFPSGVAVDNGGNIYVADRDNNELRQIVPVGTNWVVRYPSWVGRR